MPSAYLERFNRALFLASANKTPFLAISIPATAMQLTEHEQRPCFMLDAAQIHADVVDPGYGRMGRLCTGAPARSAQFNFPLTPPSSPPLALSTMPASP